jgi:hypothetical protein
MGKTRRTVEIRVDVYTRSCLTVIAVLLTVLIVALWAQPLTPGGGDQAVAASPSAPGGGIPDAGLQRETIIKELENQTSKLEALTRLLETGKAKVQVVDNGKGADK